MIQAIKAELAANPATYDALSDADVAALLNAVTVPSFIDVSIGELQKYLVREGVYDLLRSKGQGNGAAPDDLAAKSLLNTLESKIESIDVNHVTFQSGLTAIVNNGISQVHADAITALGVRLISRAQELGFKVREGDITEARAV